MLRRSRRRTWSNGGRPASRSASRPSLTRGRLLHRDADGGNETGLWVCTPGRWRCVVQRDEFCQFLTGRCVYTADCGERLEIGGGDAAFFPAGWSGRARSWRPCARHT